jgi:hypothetical protein
LICLGVFLLAGFADGFINAFQSNPSLKRFIQDQDGKSCGLVMVVQEINSHGGIDPEREYFSNKIEE